jgi:predicted metal-dependent HD superfamily phosphohydrolase
MQPSESLIAQTDIATLARQFVLHLFNQKNDPRLVFRNYRQATEIAKTVNQLAQENGLTESEWEAAELAAWFVNVGYLFDYQNPEHKSIELAEKFFAAHHLTPEKKTAIVTTLKAVFSDPSPKTPEAQVLSDAVRAVCYCINYAENVPLMRLELDLLLNQQFNKEDWARHQVSQLLNTRFYTAQAKIMYEPQLAANLLEMKSQSEKKPSKKDKDTAEPGKKFQKFRERLSPGAQTYFRTNYRTHINLSAIADNKANIMISVNAILISVIISVISYRNMTETNPAVLLPAIIFLVTGLSSLIFAVLAARPKVTSFINDATPLEEARRNLMFFGNFVALKIERYEELMDQMFQDSELLYGNMTRDLYHLGQVLDRKYRYLTISYNVFMVGFIATVLTFMFALLA